MGFLKFIYLFIFGCVGSSFLCDGFRFFVSVRRLSLVAASGGHSSTRCAGLSLSQPHLLRGTGSRRSGSAVVAHGLSCSTACGIFPDQGSNPCPLHWQADSQPLRHQGSPRLLVLKLGRFWANREDLGALHLLLSSPQIKYLACLHWSHWPVGIIESGAPVKGLETQ